MRALYGMNSILCKMMPIGEGAIEVLSSVASLKKSHGDLRDIDLFKCGFVAEIFEQNGTVPLQVYANGL